MSSVSSAQHIAVGKHSYTVKVGDPRADEAMVTSLWREGGLGSSEDLLHAAARYRWFYLRNPQGLARLNLLDCDAETDPVGSLAVGARRFSVNGEAVSSGVLVDFVVVPKHRSAFPALTLQRRSREQALAVMPLIYGLPDTKAVAVCKRLPTDIQLPLQRWVRVVRSRTYLDRMLPRGLAAGLGMFTDVLDGMGIRLQTLFASLSGDWVDGFDASFDALWSRAPKHRVAMGVRDREFLRWRFCDKPSSKPRIFAIRDQHSRELKSYFVCELHGGFLAVKDCLNGGTEREFKQGLLMLALAARKLGASAVSVEVAAGDSIHRSLRRAQYVRRSERPFFAIFDESIAAKAAGCEWFITQADEDV